YPIGPTGSQAMFIKVRCPNPACHKFYSVQGRYAGKRGKCPDCGAAIFVPNRAAPPAQDETAPDEPREEVARREAPPREEPPRGDGAHEVRVGCIGRGHAGKTALFHALSEGLVGDFLPSGLHVDAGDPREVAQMIREAEETQRLLQLSG